MEKGRKILVIDDDDTIQWVIRKVLEPVGFAVTARGTIAEGITDAPEFPLIILDLRLPDGNGIDALKKIREINCDAMVIIVTAHGRMEDAIGAMREGAYDYLEKPFDVEELKIVVERAVRDLGMREELLALRIEKSENAPLRIIGKSRKMLKISKEIGKIAPKDVTVLIAGESGTGKELVARAIHFNSRRKFGPFIAINAASIPSDLLESELFGWKKGAFTGAGENKEGKIQAAEGGTLFLDEIAELNIDLQAKLLRFLQEHEYSPLGSNRVVKADVRIIGATNKDLRECIRNNQFREDLFYRFQVMEVTIPPLRERSDDILPLAHHFLSQAVVQFDLQPREFSADALAALTTYDWPGNVRELENMIKRASILSRGSIIEKKDLFGNDFASYSVRDFLENKLNGFISRMQKMEKTNLYNAVISEVEKALFDIVLRETNGNQVRAAKILGINRNTLGKKAREYDIH